MANPPSSFPGMITPGEFIDSSEGEKGARLQGVEWTGPDHYYPTDTRRSDKMKTWRVVKNNSGIILKPGKRPLRLDETGELVSGYGRLGSAAANAAGCEKTVVGDENLVDQAIGTGDWFLVTVKGPTLAKNGETGGADTNIAAGDRVCAQTAASSTAGSTQLAGVSKISTATSVKALDLLGALGTALSALTTDQTNTDILVNVGEIN